MIKSYLIYLFILPTPRFSTFPNLYFLSLFYSPFQSQKDFTTLTSVECRNLHVPITESNTLLQVEVSFTPVISESE